jgi:hypothetical protein
MKKLMFIIVPTYAQISRAKLILNFTLLICVYVDIIIKTLMNQYARYEHKKYNII